MQKNDIVRSIASEQKTGEDRIPDNQALDSNAADDDQINLSATEQESINTRNNAER